MNPLILLVEDNVHILRGNERMLKRRGYNVQTAQTLGEARACMNMARPDVIVLDILLPDGNGLDFIHELRQSSHIPVLLLTGLTTSEDIVRGLGEGGDDYLTKPYDFEIFLARVNALLRRASFLPKVLQKGDLTMDIVADRALLGGGGFAFNPERFRYIAAIYGK